MKWVPIDNKDVAYQAAPDAPATSFALTYDGVMVSFIRYQMGDLTFTNPGNFSMRCFILGGSDAKKHSKVFFFFNLFSLCFLSLFSLCVLFSLFSFSLCFICCLYCF